MIKKIVTTSLTLLYFSLLLGCSSTPVNEGDPIALLKDAEDDIQSDHYQIAIDKLRSLKNKFPYSKAATDAQIRMADVYFLQDFFAEAAASYEAFRDLHPKHEKTAYASFRAAKSYYNDSPSNVARDLSSTKRALTAYEDFIHRYPNAPEVAEAQKDIASIRHFLADKELYIGNFYFKRDFYDSAKNRYKKILDLYPETEAAKTAQEKLAQIGARANPEQSKKDSSKNGRL